MLERLSKMFRLRTTSRDRVRSFRFESLEDRNMPAVVIDVGHHFVQPDTEGETVEISVSSTEASDPLVGGFNLRAQVGRSSSGPVFAGVEFGSLWNAFPHEGSRSWAGNTAQGQVSFSDGQEAKANGSLVKLTLDTTGVHAGSYALNLTATAVGNSSFFEANGSSASSVIINGVVQVLSSWQNHKVPSDVSQDGLTTPIDILLLINAVNTNGSGKLSPDSPGAESNANLVHWPVKGPKLDVDGDGILSPKDILHAVNCINGETCVSSPVAIAAAPQPAGKPDPDSASATTPPSEQSQESEEGVLNPDAQPVVDPPPQDATLPIDDEYTATDKDPTLEEYVNELTAASSLKKLL